MDSSTTPLRGIVNQLCARADCISKENFLRQLANLEPGEGKLSTNLDTLTKTKIRVEFKITHDESVEELTWVLRGIIRK